MNRMEIPGWVMQEAAKAIAWRWAETPLDPPAPPHPVSRGAGIYQCGHYLIGDDPLAWLDDIDAMAAAICHQARAVGAEQPRFIVARAAVEGGPLFLRMECAA